MTRNAYITVRDFGDFETREKLARDINEQTLFYAIHMDDYPSGPIVSIIIKQHEIAQFFDVMQQNENFNWIQFGVQLDS